MKFGKNAIIGLAVVAIAALVFVFLNNQNFLQNDGTGKDVLPSSTVTSSSSVGSVRNIQALLDHSAGYIFSGDGVSGTTITVNKGDTIKITATSNQPSHDHGITIDAYGINQVVIEPNTIMQFVADKAGTFAIYCKTCDEGLLGAHPWMTGTLVVNA